MKKTAIIGALSIALLSAGAVAQAGSLTPEEQIKTRQAGYTYMAWNLGKIKAQIIDQSVAYDQGQVSAAANTLAAIARSGMGALYGPGTDKAVGDQYTNVKPELFDNFEDVGKISARLTETTGKLVEAANSGDQAAIRVAFGDVGNTCKSCHDKYRQK